MSAFDNFNTTDTGRAEHLRLMHAKIENQGGDDHKCDDDAERPLWVLFYQGTNGKRLSMDLDAQTESDALFEACGIV
jgi:hypothetical protein